VKARDRLPSMELLTDAPFRLDRRTVRSLVDDWRDLERRGHLLPDTTDELLSRLDAGETIHSPGGFRYRGLS